ncbi:MAG: hypothetical protein OEU32_07810, partial [Acidimicrobiia bacterium]|nr:hypothetical protein [Acidimicrobiia bacterium]
MSSVRNRFVWPLVVWTLVVWVPRIRNVWSDDDLSTAGQVGRTLLATSFVVSALVVARVSWHARSRAFTSRERGAVLGLAA